MAGPLAAPLARRGAAKTPLASHQSHQEALEKQEEQGSCVGLAALCQQLTVRPRGHREGEANSPALVTVTVLYRLAYLLPLGLILLISMQFS